MEEQKQDVEFPTERVFTIQQKTTVGLICDHSDEKLVTEILNIFCRKNLSVDRASRVLTDAQTMLPLVAKIPMN